MFASLNTTDRRQLALALDLLARQLRTDGFPPPTATLRQLRNELAEADERERSEGCTPTFRRPIVNPVSTEHAAAALGVTPRAVIARLQRGTLRGEQLPDRRWIVDGNQLAPAMGTTGQAGADVDGAGTGHHPTRRTTDR